MVCEGHMAATLERLQASWVRPQLEASSRVFQGVWVYVVSQLTANLYSN